MADKRKEKTQSFEFWIKEMKEFFDLEAYEKMSSYLEKIKPEDIAEILGEFSVEQKIKIFDVLDPDDAAVVLDDTDPQTRFQILQKIDNDKLAAVLDEMPVDEAADIVEEVPKKDREDILELMEEEDAEDVQEILSYPEDSAARVMNPEFIYVWETNAVEDAVNSIREQQAEGEVFNVYVVSEDMTFKGIVPLEKLLTSPKGTLIKDIMESDEHTIYVDEDQEKAVLVMKKYDLSSLPVIDSKEKLVGRITFDDIIDIIDEERGEDISRMTGTIEEEQGKESTFKATRNRLPWLVTCMLGSIVTGLVIRAFEITLAETIALVSFIPVITATGGNSGVQASTVVVREIALGFMDYTKVFEEVWRQLKIALGLALICSVVLTLMTNIWMKDSLVGKIVGMSIFMVVVWSNVVGVLIPVAFKRLKIDPAIASGPLITTLNDVVGVFIYLSIATHFLK